MSIKRPSSPGVVCIRTVSLDSVHVMFWVYSGCFICSSDNGKHTYLYIKVDT